MTCLTEDALSWYSIDDDPGQFGELLVETMDGFVIREASEPWPDGAFRWAKLPPRLIR